MFILFLHHHRILSFYFNSSLSNILLINYNQKFKTKKLFRSWFVFHFFSFYFLDLYTKNKCDFRLNFFFHFISIFYSISHKCHCCTKCCIFIQKMNKIENKKKIQKIIFVVRSKLNIIC